ncbi:MAG: 6-phosphogluconolactonase [Bacteroidetes bacterium]|nr:MAG: 6-phosphogluconolactonase [Bacteroidota bacterium]
MNNIHVFPTIDELSAFFAQKLAELSHSVPEGKQASIALSGGSTPKGIFQYISQYAADSIHWDNIRLFWGDERCVPPEHEESNYKMTLDNLMVNIPLESSNIFRIKGENAPMEEAERYSSLVTGLLPKHKDTPAFDMVLLGLGEDGHTASIFPPDINLFDSKSLFAATQNPYTGQKRITATGRIINNARSVFLLVTGSSKAEMVARILKKQEGYEKLPASRVMPESKNLFWLLDGQAAELL